MAFFSLFIFILRCHLLIPMQLRPSSPEAYCSETTSLSSNTGMTAEQSLTQTQVTDCWLRLLPLTHPHSVYRITLPDKTQRC